MTTDHPLPRRGTRVVALRKLLAITQTEMSAITGIAQPNLSRIERGLTELTEGMAFRISQATATPIEFFDQPTLPSDPDQINFRRAQKVSARGRDFVLQSFTEIERISRHLSDAPTRVKHLPLPVAEDLDIRGADDIEWMANEVRKLIGLDRDAPIRNVIRTLERTGIAVAPIRPPTDEESSLLDGHCGMSRSAGPRPTVAYIIGQPGDRQRFTVAHELAHVVLHSRRDVPVTEREKEAHAFAGAFLLPEEVARKQISETLTLQGFMKLKAGYGLSIQSLVQRGRSVDRLSQDRVRSLMIQISSRGWRKNEPVKVGGESPMLMWTELTAKYGATPYLAASKQVGISPRFLTQWIPERRPPGPRPQRDDAPAPVVSITKRARDR